MAFQVPKVLVVSRHAGQLCATKAMLNQAGFDVAVVTNIAAAGALARAVEYTAAVVCFHTFTADEREELTLELRKSDPALKIVAQCPGCLGCEEGRLDVMGTLPPNDPVIPQIMTTLGPVQP
jgi:hypothetical protein